MRNEVRMREIAIRSDAVWLARLARSSSWPGEMAQRVEEAAAHVESWAADGVPAAAAAPDTATPDLIYRLCADNSMVKGTGRFMRAGLAHIGRTWWTLRTVDDEFITRGSWGDPVEWHP